MSSAATALAPPAPQHGAPLILDLSRSFSRAGRIVPTGIDRVERAYWKELMRRDRPVWAIVRHGVNYALLDHEAAESLMRRIESGWSLAAGLARVAPRLYGAALRRSAKISLRRKSTYSGSMAGLMVLLSARFRHGFEYLNVGHCNLDDIFLKQLKIAGAAPLRIKLHDMIPLDLPDLVREDTPALFRARASAVMTYADQIICNSAHTALRVRHYGTGLASRAEYLVAHLGVFVPKDARRRAPKEPYFVCIGTIEPRKNHAFLFDVWQRMADQAKGGMVPKLYLVGARGWRNDDVFRLLDNSPLMGKHIVECSGLLDADMFALLSGAAGLLFPSHEEGFGLPALEARALGVEVICSPLPVFRELLGGDATMLETDDPQSWVDALSARTLAFGAQSATPSQKERTTYVPTWDQHFDKVFGPETAAPDQAAQGALTSVRTV